jgi:bifunctional isochorismate lyase/aryl carrier protein
VAAGPREGRAADPRHAALLPAPFGRGDSPLPAVIDHINLLRRQAADLGIPVVFSAQPGGQPAGRRGLLRDFWGAGPPADPQLTAITDPLTPAPGEHQLTKWRYSAFVGTDLAGLLGGRDQLIITGVYGHIGILATALDAFMRDIQPFVVADAVADFSADHHRDTLRHVAGRCGQVTTTNAVTDHLLGAHTMTIETLRAQVVEVLGEPVADHDNLIDAGLDSIRLMTLVERWRADGREVSFVDLAERPTIAGWASLLDTGRTARRGRHA